MARSGASRGYREVVVINATSTASGTVSEVRQVNTTTSLDATYTTSGTRFTLSNACPSRYDTNWWPYSATPTQLMFFYNLCIGSEVDVLTKQ